MSTAPFFFTEDQLEDVSLLGLSGRAGSGKSTLSRLVCSPLGFVPLAHANWFKQKAVVLHSFPVDEVFGAVGKSAATRHHLQQRGTESGRDLHGKYVWCKMTETMMLYMYEHGVRRFVVTDVRFENELAWVNALGGRVYRIMGRGGESGKLAEHKSETELDSTPFERYIDNSPGREELVQDFLASAILGDFNIMGKL